MCGAPHHQDESASSSSSFVMTLSMLARFPYESAGHGLRSLWLGSQAHEERRRRRPLQEQELEPEPEQQRRRQEQR